LLERLFGQTIEIGLPGKDGTTVRKKISQRWFDSLVAAGKIRPVPSSRFKELEECAKTLVRMATIDFGGSLFLLLDKFPQLARVKSQEWDFFFAIGSVFAGLSDIGSRSESHKKFVRRMISDALMEWDRDGLRALEDCEGFVIRSIDSISTGDSEALQRHLSNFLGLWIVWNIFQKRPQDSDLELASVAGDLAFRMVAGCWESKNVGT